MNYHKIETDSMLNGDGLRVVLWVAGCTHNCPECHNPQTHDPMSGYELTEDSLNVLYDYLAQPHIEGITFSGGDPLCECNRDAITVIAEDIKKHYPDKTIWCYTGFTYEAVRGLDIMQYIDVLCDGPFIKAKKDEKLHWVGSSNQRVIDVAKTRATGEIVLYE